MTDPRHAQWDALAELEALERPLTPKERRQKAELSRALPELAAEEECYEVLQSALSRAPHVAPLNDPLIQAALRAVQQDPRPLPARREDLDVDLQETPEPRSLKRFVPWLAAAVVLLGVGGFGLYHGAPWGGSTSASTSTAASQGEANASLRQDSSARVATIASQPDGTDSTALQPRLLLATGEVQVDGQDGISGTPLTPGTRIQTLAGQACLGLERSVVVCLAPSSELVVRALGDRQRVELIAGRVAARLGKQPNGKDFGISTRQGTSIAVGTAFAVEVHPASHNAPSATPAQKERTELRVIEGTVRAETAGPSVLVHQNQQLALGAKLAQSLDDQSATSDRALLVAARLWSPGAENRLVLSSEPSKASVTLDSVPLGETPLSVDVTPGVHELDVRAAGYEAVERAVVFTGAPIAEHVVLHSSVEHGATARLLPASERTRAAGTSNAGAGSNAPSGVAGVASSGGPSALLERARQARQSGHFAEAAATYRELCDQHGGSAEAGPALLSLAELQLTRLGNPLQALASFGKYAARGGGLQQEAYYGRIRALRALGRSTEERRELEAFVAKYPDSAYASACKRRLAAL